MTETGFQNCLAHNKYFERLHKRNTNILEIETICILSIVTYLDKIFNQLVYSFFSLFLEVEIYSQK